MAGYNTGFEARGNATVSLTAGVASTAVRFNDSTQFPAVPHARVYNAGTDIVFIEFGDVDVVASKTTSMPIPPGWPVCFRPGGASWMAAVSNGGGVAVVYVTPGYGSS